MKMHSTATSNATPTDLLVGVEWVVDAQGCAPELLRDLDRLRLVCDQVVDDLGLNVVGDPQCHQFPEPGGVTALYLLSESHLACHTYPEYALATFNLYCCCDRESWAWESNLRAHLGAKDVQVRRLDRGQHISAAASSRLSCEAPR
jgi:S-adenosylmethionine decarboxylase